jgi:hypothetical protein
VARGGLVLISQQLMSRDGTLLFKKCEHKQIFLKY